MRDQVLQSIRERALLGAGDRVAVAVSGGADSVALLHVLLELRMELGIVLGVAHFNHGLRDDAAADEAFVADLAKHHRLEFFVGHGNVRDHALTSKLSIEAAGRELRYRWFAALAIDQRLDAIATAHTLDDQAETVLLKLLRGAGTRGLAGIYPVVQEATGAKAPSLFGEVNGTPEGGPLQNRRLSSAEADFDSLDAGLKAGSNVDLERAPQDAGLKAGSIRTRWQEGRPRQGETLRLCKVIRPLLRVSRRQVEDYLTTLGQSWREDESNLDRRFLRNRVRHELLPLLEREFNPNIRGALSDLAEIARGEEDFWRLQVARELSARLQPQPNRPLNDSKDASLVSGHGLSRADQGRLDLAGFVALPLALQRRALKSFAERQRLTLDFAHIERLRRCALGELSRTELPGGRLAEKDGPGLYLSLPPARQERASYQYALSVPGQVVISELELTLRAELVGAGLAQELTPGGLLSLELVGPQLTVRNWLAGDRFWPAHSGSAEKLKRLFAEKRIPAADRPCWPVLLSGDEIVWVRGFPVAMAYQWKGQGVAVRIEAIPG